MALNLNFDSAILSKNKSYFVKIIVGFCRMIKYNKGSVLI